jgi:ubiquinone/menaquinone biosynthesis C-methylase UbiE
MDLDSIARTGYNLLAPFYDFFFGADVKSERMLRQNLVEHLGLKTGYNVLEVSVGTGANLPNIYKRIGKNGRISGLDISEGMLARCRENIKKWGIPAELVIGNAAHLPYKDNSFDAVLHFGGLNYFSDKRKSIMEMVRVAKPGARIVIGDEWMPFLKITDPPMGLVPKDAVGLKLAKENFIFDYWVIEFRKPD